MNKHILAALALITLFLPSVVTAQVTYEGCVDFRGIPVASVLNPYVQDVAVANYAPNGAPIIIYNPNVLAQTRPKTRLFFYAHECGHHVLAHGIRGIPLTREQEADCWAIRTLVDKGLVTDDDVTDIQSDIAQFGRGDWTHLPGPYRAIALRERCLGQTVPQRPAHDSWDVCYDRCQSAEERCTSRCSNSSDWNRCYDRCQSRFDSCTGRCSQSGP